MRIAIYYSVAFGRNDGPPLYWWNQLRKLKDVEVVHLDPTKDTRRYGKFDLHFWIDWGEDGLPVDPFWMPKEDGGTRIYVCSDAHISPEGKEYRFKKAHQFDYVYFNQKKFMSEFATWNLNNSPDDSRILQWHYLPHAVEPQAYPLKKIAKKFDVGFIGHIQDSKNVNGMTRIEALDKLFKKYPNFYFGTRHPAFPDKNMFEHAAEKFAQSRIIFNISIKDDVNMRIFEAMATGSFMLTNRFPELEQLFTDGEHCGMYSSYEEMLDKVQYYLDHEDEREKIASQGCKEVLGKHTYRARLEKVLDQMFKNGHLKEKVTFK